MIRGRPGLGGLQGRPSPGGLFQSPGVMGVVARGARVPLFNFNIIVLREC